MQSRSGHRIGMLSIVSSRVCVKTYLSLTIQFLAFRHLDQLFVSVSFNEKVELIRLRVVYIHQTVYAYIG